LKHTPTLSFPRKRESGIGLDAGSEPALDPTRGPTGYHIDMFDCRSNDGKGIGMVETHPASGAGPVVWERVLDQGN
jgi:hypothetical protein